MSTHEIWSLAEPELSLSLLDDFKTNKIHSLMNQFIFSDDDVNTLKMLFDKEVDEGLKKDTTSNLKDVSRMGMNVTYFTELFDGTENGGFVVMNLTAQNLILMYATIKPGFPIQTIRRYFTIDETIRSSPYIKIFEYLCECLLKFFTENDLLKKPQILGFCTDLPLLQFDIDTAVVSYFTTAASEFPLNYYDIRKCFEIVLLQERFQDINFNLIVITSNNMSLMIHSSYIYGPIDVFLNLDDDCDLIYQEDVKNVHKWKAIHSRITHVFIDTELRNLGKSGTLNFIATTVDWSVISEPLSLTHDKECRLQNFLVLKYVLELIRHILIYFHHENVYCREGDVGDLYKVNGISLLSILNFLKMEDPMQALQVLPGGTISIAQDDVVVAKYICKIVLIRVALLAAICVSRIFLRLKKDDLILAIKCPLMDKYVDFEMYIRKFMAVLAPEKKFQIFFIKDDVCMEGAALATSIIKRKGKIK